MPVPAPDYQEYLTDVIHTKINAMQQGKGSKRAKKLTHYLQPPLSGYDTSAIYRVFSGAIPYRKHDPFNFP